MDTKKPPYLLSQQQLRRRIQAEESKCAEMLVDVKQEAISDSSDNAIDHVIPLDAIDIDPNSQQWLEDEEIDNALINSDDEDLNETNSENPAVPNSITIDLAQWAAESQLRSDTLNKLLLILNKHKINVPKTSTMLLTPPNTKIILRPITLYHLGTSAPQTLKTEGMNKTSRPSPKLCSWSENTKQMNIKLDQLTYLVKDMSRRMINQNSGRRSTEVDNQIKTMFPIKTIQDLKELEARCADSAFRNNIMNHLANLVNSGQGLTIAFQKTLCDQMTINCNYAGTHKKIPFMNFKEINEIMFDAWKSPVDSMESFQNKLRKEFRKAHNRVHNKKITTVSN